jgi:two-component system, NtrC family, sensor kinase
LGLVHFCSPIHNGASFRKWGKIPRYIMKLTSKILAVFLVAVILLTIVAGYLTIHSAYADLQRRQQELAQRLADEMQERIVSAWQADGMRGVGRTLEGQILAAKEPLSVRWVWFNPQTPAEHLPRASAETWQYIRLGQILSVVDEDAARQRTLYTYLPIRMVGGETGGLELMQPLAAFEQQTRQVVYGSLLIIIFSAVVGLIMAYLAGVRWVATPLQALIRKTERIGQGDFSEPLTFQSRDELEQLAEALNAMCERLAEQQQMIATEMSERLKTVQQLRHADRLSTLGRMAAGIAHELGTPLNVVAGRAALISSGRLPPDEIASSARTIKSEADRITAIVQRLLDFARQRRPQRQPSNVGALAAKTLSLLQTMAEKKPVRLELELPPEPVVASLDEAQLQQVLTNLLVNAIQATPAQGRVRVALSSGRGEFRVQVADSGPGVPEELRERIFEPFFTTKDVGEGTGLGLSIAYGIVQEHGGRIEVGYATDSSTENSSTALRGAVFEVILPVSGESQHE